MLFQKTLKDYAENLFTLDSSWYIKRKQKGRAVIDKQVDNNAYLVRNFIVPFWGDILLDKLSPKIINEKLLFARSRRGIEITFSTKNKILSCLSEIYKYLIEEEITDENPVKKVMRFSSQTTNPRRALTPDEMQKLFPENHEDLLKIWGSQLYICAFLVLKDTGMRPNELIALQWKDWYADIQFFPVIKAVEASTRNKIKSTKTGITKPAIISEQTTLELENFKNMSCSSKDAFIFSYKNGLPIGIHTLSRHFLKGAKIAGIDHYVSTYWLRHTFNTRALERFSEDIVQRLMGHSTQGMTRRYRDADVYSLMREAKKIQAIMHTENLKEAA